MSLSSITAWTAAAATPAIDNPIDGVVPDFTVFGTEFDALWKKLFAAVWAAAIVWSLARLLIAIASASNARASNHPTQTAEARRDVASTGVAVVGVVAFGVIVTAIIALVG